LLVSDAKRTLTRVKAAIRHFAFLYPNDPRTPGIRSILKPDVPVVFVTEGDFHSSKMPRLSPEQYKGMTREYIPNTFAVVHITPTGDDATVIHELIHALGYGEKEAYRVGDMYRAHLTTRRYEYVDRKDRFCRLTGNW
jgi:hypothetical protein